jgi:hypothetical protein
VYQLSQIILQQESTIPNDDDLIGVWEHLYQLKHEGEQKTTAKCGSIQVTYDRASPIEAAYQSFVLKRLN